MEKQTSVRNAEVGLVVLSLEEIREAVERLSREHLECTAEEAFRRLDAGELEDYPVAFELRGYRNLGGKALQRSEKFRRYEYDLETHEIRRVDEEEA